MRPPATVRSVSELSLCESECSTITVRFGFWGQGPHVFPESLSHVFDLGFQGLCSSAGIHEVASPWSAKRRERGSWVYGTKMFRWKMFHWLVFLSWSDFGGNPARRFPWWLLASVETERADTTRWGQQLVSCLMYLNTLKWMKRSKEGSPRGPLLGFVNRNKNGLWAVQLQRRHHRALLHVLWVPCTAFTCGWKMLTSPWSFPKILVIDSNTNATTLINAPTSTADGNSYGIVEGPNGELYASPFDAGEITSMSNGWSSSSRIRFQISPNISKENDGWTFGWMKVGIMKIGMNEDWDGWRLGWLKIGWMKVRIMKIEMNEDCGNQWRLGSKGFFENERSHFEGFANSFSTKTLKLKHDNPKNTPPSLPQQDHFLSSLRFISHSRNYLHHALVHWGLHATSTIAFLCSVHPNIQAEWQAFFFSTH